MKTKTIGTTDISVPSLILGGNIFGWSVDEARSFELLDAAVERGLSTIDTADIYSFWGPGNQGGESETIIGRWLKQRGRHHDVAIHTKGGAPGAPGEFANARLDAAYLTKAVDGSLRRLGLDRIDLYYVHYDDEVTPPEETLAAFADLIKAGKIGAIAASNYTPERLAAALAVSEQNNLPRFAGLQTLYNLYDRSAYEDRLEALCMEKGLGVMSYFSLAHGFLTGKYRSQKDIGKTATRGNDVKAYLTARGDHILDALDRAAVRFDAKPAHVALAWLMARPSITAPVASATTLAQLDDLVAATELTLDADTIAALDDASTTTGKAA